LCESEHFPTKTAWNSPLFQAVSSNFSKLNIGNSIGNHKTFDMKIADLYIRVSTDEQADKGYSQRSQEELLRRYCGLNNISVRQVIFEDHSAKTFNRPQWGKYLLDLKRNRARQTLYYLLNGIASAAMPETPIK
jgi:hypothetical protein